MKAKVYYLVNQTALKNAVSELVGTNADGTLKMTISDASGKSSKQRSLQWKWYSEISRSGIGDIHDSSETLIHLKTKYLFALPILLRDDSFFNELYTLFKNKYYSDSERLKWFTDTQIHTEAFSVSQMSEFLSNVFLYYTEKGVNLTNPDDLGLDDYAKKI